jgi:glycine cleavage system H lipoate-binding protein
MSVPTHLKYTADHEWLTLADGIATVGVTAFAADALGDVVHVELPDAGTRVSAGESCGELESTKSLSDLARCGPGSLASRTSCCSTATPPCCSATPRTHSPRSSPRCSRS